MFDYTVREVSLADPTIRHKVVALMKEAGVAVSVETLERGSSQPSLYLAAMIGEEIVGFNAFASHDFLLAGNLVQGYQGYWTATSPQHAFKKIFETIVLAAHRILRARGVGFVFGFPNNAYLPLLTRMLAYRELPCLKWQMLNIAGIKHHWFSSFAGAIDAQSSKVLRPDEAQLITLKRAAHPDLVEAVYRGSLAWGVRKSIKRARIPVPFLDVGGMDLRSADHLQPLLHNLQMRAGPIAYVQTITIQGSSYGKLLARMRPSPMASLVVHDLNGDTSDLAFDFLSGVRAFY